MPLRAAAALAIWCPKAIACWSPTWLVLRLVPRLVFRLVPRLVPCLAPFLILWPPFGVCFGCGNGRRTPHLKDPQRETTGPQGATSCGYERGLGAYLCLRLCPILTPPFGPMGLPLGPRLCPPTWSLDVPSHTHPTWSPIVPRHKRGHNVEPSWGHKRGPNGRPLVCPGTRWGWLAIALRRNIENPLSHSLLGELGDCMYDCTIQFASHSTRGDSKKLYKIDIANGTCLHLTPRFETNTDTHDARITGQAR